MVAITGIFGDITNLIPSTSELVQQLAVGTGVSVLLAGAKSQAGQDALDPLHLFHHDPAPVPPTNNPNAIVGPTITSSAFAALPATSQGTLLAAGVHIVAG